jgi:uncharacterized membrane protein (UPF0136 family)
MKKQAYIIFAYSLFLLIGGLAGYLFKGSVASLVMSSFFAVLLLTSGFALLKQYRAGYLLSLGVTSFLMLFFSYRFYRTGAIMPAGISCVLTLAVLYVLLTTNNKNSMVKRNEDISQ